MELAKNCKAANYFSKYSDETTIGKFEANPAGGLPGRPANTSSAHHISLDSTQGKLDSILSKYQGQ